MKESVCFSAEFLVDPLDRGSLILWEPYLIDGRTFKHSVLALWHNQWGVVFGKDQLQALYTQLHGLWDTQQSQSQQPQVFSSCRFNFESNLAVFCTSFLYEHMSIGLCG